METLDIIAGAALLAAMVGLVFTGMQIRYNSAVQRGMLYKDLYERFLADPEFHYVYGLIVECSTRISMSAFWPTPSFTTSMVSSSKARGRVLELLQRRKVGLVSSQLRGSSLISRSSALFTIEGCLHPKT